MKHSFQTTVSGVLRTMVPAFGFAWNINHYPQLLHKKQFIAETFYRYIPLTFFFTWLFSLITTYGSAVYIVVMLLGVYISYVEKRGQKGYEHALYYFVVLNFCFLGFRAFVGHTLLADSVANSIGWLPGNMFQIELAFYHLGFALATLVYIWTRSKELLLGLIVAKSVFLFGAMGVHIYEALAHGNFNVGNIGIGIIYGDFVVPVVLIYLFIKSYPNYLSSHK